MNLSILKAAFASASVIIFTLSSLLWSQFSISAPVQWVDGNGHWYEAFIDPSVSTWQEMNDHATSQGGYLTTITSDAENQFVFSLIDSSEFWIVNWAGDYAGPVTGGIQAPDASEPDGGWGWVTGESFSYSAWAAGQPNNATAYGDQEVIHFWVQNATGFEPTWQDISQTPLDSPVSWVVEYDSNPIPIPAATWLFGSALAGLIALRHKRN